MIWRIWRAEFKILSTTQEEHSGNDMNHSNKNTKVCRTYTVIIIIHMSCIWRRSRATFVMFLLSV